MFIQFERNVSNDQQHARELRRLGRHVLTVWECQLKNPEKRLQQLKKQLNLNIR